MNETTPQRNNSPKHQAKRLVKDQGIDFLIEEVTIPLTISRIGLMALHGSLCLALRHPQFTGPSREIVINATKQIGKYLVDTGILTAQQLSEAEKLEAEEGSQDLLSP